MLIQLAAIGLLVALLPLSIVWGARDEDKYRKLLFVTAFLTFDLVLFGAFTRLTDSGLGCPDWPGCFGYANPLVAHGDIHLAEKLMPSGPVTMMKAWIEMIHRYMAMGIGVLIIAIMVVAWSRWIKRGRSMNQTAPWFPTFLFAFVCLQGAFGAFTVTMKLQPIIVTIHLLLGITLLALLVWMVARHKKHPTIAPTARTLGLPALIALVVVAMQIGLGGWVSTNYAALACHDFPLCHGKWLPEMDFVNGFTLWRALGKTVTGEYLPFPALTAIHWTHRTFAIVVALMVMWVGFRALSIDGLRNCGRGLLLVIGLQLATGIATIFLQWPLSIAVMHNAGATLLVILLVMLNYKVRSISGHVTSTDPA